MSTRKSHFLRASGLGICITSLLLLALSLRWNMAGRAVYSSGPPNNSSMGSAVSGLELTVANGHITVVWSWTDLPNPKQFEFFLFPISPDSSLRPFVITREVGFLRQGISCGLLYFAAFGVLVYVIGWKRRNAREKTRGFEIG